MESLTTAEAAARLGVPVWKFHREYAPRIAPVLEAPGKRGAKFWNLRDIDRLADELTAERATGPAA
jgi:hypothetical protein